MNCSPNQTRQKSIPHLSILVWLEEGGGGEEDDKREARSRRAKVATLRWSDLSQRCSAVINLAARRLTSQPAPFPRNLVSHCVLFDVFFFCLVFEVITNSRRFCMLALTHFRLFVVVFDLGFGLFLWLIVTWYGGRKHGSMLLC